MFLGASFCWEKYTLMFQVLLLQQWARKRIRYKEKMAKILCTVVVVVDGVRGKLTSFQEKTN